MAPAPRDRHHRDRENRSGTIEFAIAVHGTRGGVEPATAVAREPQRRGHDVRMAVPPNLVGFAEANGVGSVNSYGPDSQRQLPIKVLHQAREDLIDGWAGAARLHFAFELASSWIHRSAQNKRRRRLLTMVLFPLGSAEKALFRDFCLHFR